MSRASDEAFFSHNRAWDRFARRRAVDIEFVGGPRDGERVRLLKRWTLGSNISFRMKPDDVVVHWYQVQEKPEGALYFMYVGPAKET